MIAIFVGGGRMCAGLIEPEPIKDIFASGLAAVEDLGNGCVRFLLYTTQSGNDGEVERICVAKIVMSKAAAIRANQKSTDALSDIAGHRLHLVR